MTFKEFAEANKQRCESKYGFSHSIENWSSSDWMTALIGEVGEAANIIKKLNRVRDYVPGNKETPEELLRKLKGELADIFIYLDLLCQHEEIDLEEAIKETWNKKSKQIGYGIKI